jgi:histone-lysine N-methyltransferase SETMAR
MGWEIMNHHPYTPDLAPSNFHLFWQMNLHLDRVEFQTDAELQCSVLNWVHSHDKTFYTAHITKLQDGKKR